MKLMCSLTRLLLHVYVSTFVMSISFSPSRTDFHMSSFDFSRLIHSVDVSLSTFHIDSSTFTLLVNFPSNTTYQNVSKKHRHKWLSNNRNCTLQRLPLYIPAVSLSIDCCNYNQFYNISTGSTSFILAQSSYLVLRVKNFDSDAFVLYVDLHVFGCGSLLETHLYLHLSHSLRPLVRVHIRSIVHV